MTKSASISILDFDIDRYINPYIPYSRVSRLPQPVARFLGYRKSQRQDIPSLLRWLWAFVGALIGILVVSALSKYAPGLKQYNPPVIIASLGASAILDYNAIHTPLAQPRNAFFGQILSAIVGVCISKLFQLNSNFDDLQWVAGAICCATSSLVMGLTNTVHPPGGATAILAATNSQIIAMGWIFIPFIMLGSVVMLAIALIVNNMQRQYPDYWWTAESLRQNDDADVEENLEKVATNSSERALRMQSEAQDMPDDHDTLIITADHLLHSNSLDLSDEELRFLRQIQARLRKNITDVNTSLSQSLDGTSQSQSLEAND